MNIKDIAKLAGVGVSTVSRVLNNYPDVSNATREKILRIVKESNYIPNSSARSLKQNNTKNVGILVKGIFNPFFSEIINIIACSINDTGYTMILHQNYSQDYSDMDILNSFIRDKKLQGVICLGGDFSDIDEKLVENAGTPIVLTSVNMHNKEYTSGYSYISIDDKSAVYNATNLLLEYGHRDIGFIIGGREEIDSVGPDRLEGFKKALQDYGIEFNDKSLLYGEYTSRVAYKVTKELLKDNNKVTAIFATSDIMAIGSAKAITDLGKKIGEDIALIGFDGMEISEFYTPRISTVKQPKEDMANMSWELLYGLMQNKVEHKRIILETELLIRESCKRIKV